MKWIKHLLEVKLQLLNFWNISKEFGLFCNNLNMIISAILLSQVEKTCQFVDGVRQKYCVISLSYSRHNSRANVDTKTRSMCSGKLKIVAKFVQSVGIYTSLFNSKRVLNWSHPNLVPFNHSFPILKS